MIDVGHRGRIVDGDLVDVEHVEERAEPAVARQIRGARERDRAEQHRVSRYPVGDRARGRRTVADRGAALADDPSDEGGVDERLVGEQHQGARAAHLGESGPQRCADPSAQSVATITRCGTSVGSAARTVASCAPTTTITSLPEGSPPAAARTARATSASPSQSAAAFAPPKRRPAPAASTTPVIG